MTKQLGLTTSRPLDGLKVLELSHRFSGPYCGMLLAELGAIVTKVEAPGGDSQKAKGRTLGGYGPSYLALNRGKNVIQLDLKTRDDRAYFDGLLDESDVFITNLRPSALNRLSLGPGDATYSRPRLVYTSLSSSGWLPDDLDIGLDDGAAQALTGMMYATGWPEDGPVHAPIPLAAQSNALFGAIATVSACVRRQSSGLGARLSVPMVDALASCLEFPLMHTASTGSPPVRNGGRHPVGTPSQVFHTKDGRLSLMASSDAEFDRLAKALDAGWLSRDDRFISTEDRLNNRDVLCEEIEKIFTNRGTVELANSLSSLGVACAPEQTLAELLKDMEIINSGSMRKIEGDDGTSVRTMNIPGGAVASGGEGLMKPRFEDNFSQNRHAEPFRSVEQNVVQDKNSHTSLLHGVRVADFTRYLSGPFATSILADLGASVVKIESMDGDPTRVFRPKIDGVGGYFTSVNRGKSSVSIDLKTKPGVERAKEIIKNSDIVVDNFRPGVMERLGLGPDILWEINPNLIVLSISGYGKKCKYKERAAFDMTIQSFCGLTSQTGYESSGPTRLGVSIGDIGAGMFTALNAVSSMVAPKENRRRYTDIAMVDSLLCLMEPLIWAYDTNRFPKKRLGSANINGAPMGAYRTKTGYVYISAADNGSFLKLVNALDALGTVEKCWISNREKRTLMRENVDRWLNETLSVMDSDSVIARLSCSGIIAVPVRTLVEAVNSDLFTRRRLLCPSVVKDTNGKAFSLVRSPIHDMDIELPSTLPSAPPIDGFSEYNTL